MPRRLVDRGAPLDGINNTLRDSNLPYSMVREMENFRLPDKRLIRRKGYGEWSQARDKGNMLTKATGAGLEKCDVWSTSDNWSQSSWYRTPFSYGLLRWHTDFQPKADSDWTLEFTIKLGEEEPLLTEGFIRKSLSNGGSNDPSFDVRQSKGGVYVYDQMVWSNDCTFSDDGGSNSTTLPQLGGGTDYEFDVVALPALSVAYRKAGGGTLVVDTEWTLMVGNSYYRYQQNYATNHAYAVGDSYHIAITYDADAGASSLGQLAVLVSPVGAGTLDTAVLDTNAWDMPAASAAWLWAGELDCLNDYTTSDSKAIQRDIVLLNEATVRGHYSSTCAFRGTGNESDYTTSLNAAAASPNCLIHTTLAPHTTNNIKQPNPWCLSPPRGTGMAELRWWDDLRTAAELLAYSDRGMDPSLEENLVGYWKLNDGSNFCRDIKGSDGIHKNISVHHSNPAWVTDSGLLNGIGLHFADNQYMVRRFEHFEYRYISGAAAALRDVFMIPRAYAGTAQVDGEADFTVQMQLRTPHSWQQMISEHEGTVDPQGANLGSAARHRGGVWWDGEYDASGNRAHVEEWDNNQTKNAAQWAERDDPYYMTLWSVEGIQNDSDGASAKDTGMGAQLTKIPVAQGLLAYDGTNCNVVFRFFGSITSDSGTPFLYKFTSSEALSLNTVYTLTFRKKYQVQTETANDECMMEIFIDDAKDGTSIVLRPGDAENSFPIDHNAFTESKTAAGTYTTSRSSRYDVLVGASKLGDIKDHDLGPGYDLDNEPPLLKTGLNHWMTPFGDQPGFFTLGFFRLWSGGISDEKIKQTWNSSMLDRMDQNLIFNVEPERVTGDRVPSFAAYKEIFELGYVPVGAGFPLFNIKSGLDDLEEYIPAAMVSASCEDCLGYSSLPEDFTVNTSSSGVGSATCRALVPFRSTISGVTSFITVMDDHLKQDASLDGDLTDLHIASAGLVSDFAPSSTWTGTTISDRVFMAGEGGRVKVFDGTVARRAGGRITTNVFMAIATDTNGVLPKGWYGVRGVYTDDAFEVITMTHRQTLELASAKSRILISELQDHPDPRVTNFQLYITSPQETRSLAESAPLKLTFEGWQDIYPRIGRDEDYTYIAFGDHLPINTVLLEDFVPVPTGSTIEGFNGRLFVSGNLLEPDVVFYSDPGVPERFSRGSRIVLEESRGDRVVAMQAAYGALFIFKENSVWRVDEVSAGVMQATKLADDLGAVSTSAVQKLTLPDAGRAVIFFWSRHGPYLFDGSTFNYVGFPLEESFEDTAYGWIANLSEITTLHEASDREVICFYPSSTSDAGENGDERVNKAVVYNYRNNTWYRYTGLSCGSASTMVGLVDEGGVEPNSYAEPAKVDYASTYLSLVGGTNGHVYRWGRDREGNIEDYDGRPDDDGGYTLRLITAANNNRLTLADVEFDDISGLWATVFHHPDNQAAPVEWFSCPILENGTAEITLDPSYWAPDDYPFTIEPTEDLVVIGLPPASATFPWDNMELPFYDKEVHRIYTWTDGEFFLATAKDWQAGRGPWLTVADANTKRRSKEINKSAESLKLYLMSREERARMDAYAYEVAYTAEGDRDE